MWAVQQFRQYLHGHHFNLVTDHAALEFLLGPRAAASTNKKHQRWIMELQSYDFSTQHRPGEQNVAPDALSRCYSVSIVIISNDCCEQRVQNR